MAGRTFKIDFTVSDLLHNVDIVLGITWLKEYNPLVDWSSGKSVHFGLPQFDEIVWRVVKCQVQDWHCKNYCILMKTIETLKNPAVTAKIQVIANPRFWQFENCMSSFFI